VRAFTEGVSKEGRPFFPVMPYPFYSQMAREDALAIVAYLRTLAPIENPLPESHANFLSIQWTVWEWFLRKSISRARSQSGAARPRRAWRDHGAPQSGTLALIDLTN